MLAALCRRASLATASPIAVEQTANGYQVVWKVKGADQFNVWNTDSNGNFLSYTPVVIGHQRSAEVARNKLPAGPQRRWHDRRPVIRRSHRGVWRQPTWSVADNTYHFSVGSSGTELRYGGSAVVVGQFGSVAPIAVEQTANGYQVAWKVNGADQFIVWNTDSNGNFLSYTPLVSGTSATLKSLETSFQQDLNGDGVIGGSGTASHRGVWSNQPGGCR